MAGAAWYRYNTVTVTNGSVNVVGVQTAFLSQVSVGDIFTVDGTKIYEIASVVDDTHLTLQTPYTGSSGSTTYGILRNFTTTTNATLAASLTALLASWQTREDQMRTWLGGAVKSGYRSDGTPASPAGNDPLAGYYPMSDAVGATRYIPCPALLNNAVQAYYGAAGGTANALTLTPSPTLTQYLAGVPIGFLASADNTGAATVNISGLGAKNIVRPDGAALRAGDLKNGQAYTITYNGTAFNLAGSSVDAIVASSMSVVGPSKFNPSSGFTSFSAIDTGWASCHGYSASNFGVKIGSTGGAGVIQVGQNTTAYPLFIQPYGSNVLIGTTTDNGTDKLQVNGSVNIAGNSIVGDSSTTTTTWSRFIGVGGTFPGAVFKPTTGTVFSIGADGSSFLLRDQTNSATRLAVASNGTLTTQGYCSDVSSNNANQSNGQILLGGTPAYQARISYGGATGGEEHLYIVNTYDNANAGIVLKTRGASATPVTAVLVTGSGDLCAKVNTSAPAIPNNSMMSFQLVSNTQLKILVKGSDGLTRATTLTLA